MADIVKNPVSSAIYLEKKDAALLERLKKIHPVKDLFTGKTIWKDTLKGLVYRRLIGGIAWPYWLKNGTRTSRRGTIRFMSSMRIWPLPSKKF